MGSLCSKAEVDDPARNQEQVTDVDNLQLGRSDFVSANKGVKYTDAYQTGQVLGSGAFGEVRKCMNRNTRVIRAVKMLKKDAMTKQELSSFKNEAGIMKEMDHPNIIKIYEMFEDEKKYYLVQELCKGGELFDEIVKQERFSEQDASKIIYQILYAIAFVHDKGVVHGDIKPENILIDKEADNILKLIDFGAAQRYKRGAGTLKSMVGTSYYVAPEVLNKSYDERSDVWSIGVMLYILLSGRPPFDGDDDTAITNKVKKGNYDLDTGQWKSVSRDAKALINKMLTFDYKQRPFARPLLQEKWFKGASAEPLAADLLRECLQNLKDFNATKKLQQATMTMMVQNTITKDETARLQRIFKELDENQDGKLQKEEVLKGYTQFFGEEEAERETERIFKVVDTDNSGEIDFAEFVTATVSRNDLFTEEKLKQAFDYYDADKSGTISTGELKAALGAGKNISMGVWEKVLSEVDKDGSGEIDFPEFKQMMKKLNEPSDE